MLVAIVSQNYFVLVFKGIAQLSRDTLQMGYRTDVPVRHQGGGSLNEGG